MLNKFFSTPLTNKTIGGILLFLSAFFMLNLNEELYIERQQEISKEHEKTITIDLNKIDIQNNYHPVYLQGALTTNEILTDNIFNISTRAIKLQRIVELYQWRESNTRNNYSYEKIWHNDLIDSNKFRDSLSHQNPRTIAINSENFLAQEVKLGIFTISPALINILQTSPFPLTETNFKSISPELQKAFKLYEGAYYYSLNPKSPKIGDLRIRYEIIEPNITASLIGMQLDANITSYKGSNLIKLGSITKEDMFYSLEDRFLFLRWIARIIGIALIYMGIRIINNLLATLPTTKKLVDFTSGNNAILLSFILGLTIIALAWLEFKPLISYIIFAIIIGLKLLILILNKTIPTKIFYQPHASISKESKPSSLIKDFKK